MIDTIDRQFTSSNTYTRMQAFHNLNPIMDLKFYETDKNRSIAIKSSLIAKLFYTNTDFYTKFFESIPLLESDLHKFTNPFQINKDGNSVYLIEPIKNLPLNLNEISKAYQNLTNSKISREEFASIYLINKLYNEIVESKIKSGILTTALRQTAEQATAYDPFNLYR